MEDQKKSDKVLRAKLKDFEMAPPPMLFDQIIKRVNPAFKKVVPEWYLRPQVQWAAASFAIFAMAAALWLSEIRNNNTPDVRSNLAKFDTITNELRDDQLQGLELLAEQMVIERKQEIKQAMQPEAVSERLLGVEAETVQSDLTRQTIDAMEPRNVQSLKSRSTQLPLKASASTIFEGAPEYTKLPNGVIPALIKSYGILSNADLFAIAKEKFEDFKTKEHYVSFNLGSLEIGQTIRLGKQENSKEN